MTPLREEREARSIDSSIIAGKGRNAKIHEVEKGFDKVQNFI